MTNSAQCVIPSVTTDSVVLPALLGVAVIVLLGVGVKEWLSGNLKFKLFSRDKLSPTGTKWAIGALALMFWVYGLSAAGDWVAQHWLTCGKLVLPETWPASVMLSGLAISLAVIYICMSLCSNPLPTGIRKVLGNLTISLFSAATAMVITTIWNNILAVVWVPVVIAFLPLLLELGSDIDKGSAVGRDRDLPE